MKQTINFLELARESRELTGEFKLSDCERLRGMVVERRGVVTFRIKGSKDEHGRPQVLVELNGTLKLVCQRCLAPFNYPLRHSATMLLAADREELASWDEELVETMLADRPVDRFEWLEDELLLSLPYAPRHAEGECETLSIAEPKRMADKPLAVLQVLKRNETSAKQL